MFKNDNEFRQGLAEILKSDPYFRQHIQNGWHSIAIEKGLMGGRVILPNTDLKTFNDTLEQNNQGLKVDASYKEMVKEVDRLPGRIRNILPKLSKEDAKKFEENMKDLNLAIEKLKEMEPVGHKDSQDLADRQAKAQHVLDVARKVLNDFAGNESVQSRNKAFSTLLASLGFYEDAQRFNPDVRIKNTSSKPTNGELVNNWQTSQEQYRSDETTEKLKQTHVDGKITEIPLTPQQEIFSNFAKTLQNNPEKTKAGEEGSKKIYDPEAPKTDNQRDKHTFAVSTIPGDKDTIYVGGNYFNDIKGETLTKEQEGDLLDKIKEEHPQEIERLKELGYNKIQYIKRDPSTYQGSKFI
uniref:Uncharacterized protein n=1 Tax=Panagrolaimus sp. PS1159 TaxID=55785 RepID=A0AC35G9X4_9BILA